MKRSLAVVAVCSMVLAGCAHKHAGLHIADRQNPKVTVKDGRIEVPVLFFFRGERDVRVTWHLPEGSNLRFADNGIEFEGEITEQLQRGTPDGSLKDSLIIEPKQTEIECSKRAEKGGLAFSCLNHNTRPGLYKYTIRIREGSKLLERDPPFLNW